MLLIITNYILSYCEEIRVFKAGNYKDCLYRLA